MNNFKQYFFSIKSILDNGLKFNELLESIYTVDDSHDRYPNGISCDVGYGPGEEDGFWDASIEYKDNSIIIQGSTAPCGQGTPLEIKITKDGIKKIRGDFEVYDIKINFIMAEPNRSEDYDDLVETFGENIEPRRG